MQIGSGYDVTRYYMPLEVRISFNKEDMEHPEKHIAAVMAYWCFLGEGEGVREVEY